MTYGKTGYASKWIPSTHKKSFTVKTLAEKARGSVMKHGGGTMYLGKSERDIPPEDFLRWINIIEAKYQPHINVSPTSLAQPLRMLRRWANGAQKPIIYGSQLKAINNIKHKPPASDDEGLAEDCRESCCTAPVGGVT